MTGRGPRAIDARAARLLAALVVVSGLAAPARAQVRPARFQVSVGGLWASAIGFGTRAATETLNQPGGGRYTLFETKSQLEAAGGLEGRLAVRLGRELAVDVGASWARRRLSTRVSGDVEGGVSLVATADVSEYVLDGGVRWSPARFARAGGRVAPFVAAGVGYLRQVYAGRTVAETGTRYHAGGGAVVWLRAPRAGRPPRLGARGDARWTLVDGGIALGGSSRHAGAEVVGALVLQLGR
jgi:hypothetical protein